MAQLVPSAEILVVTTPQVAAAEVAERAGAIALQTRQQVVGVVENMSGLAMPDGTTMHLFGEGGGARVAERLTRAMACIRSRLIRPILVRSVNTGSSRETPRLIQVGLLIPAKRLLDGDGGQAPSGLNVAQDARGSPYYKINSKL